MKFQKESIVVSLIYQKISRANATIDLGYINKVAEHYNENGSGIYFNETPSNSGYYLFENFRLATPFESQQFVIKGPHVLTPNQIMPTTFLKGDYIVLTKLPANSGTIYKLDTVYKQAENSKWLMIKSNEGHAGHRFDKSTGNDWRYATADDISLYDLLNGIKAAPPVHDPLASNPNVEIRFSMPRMR